MVAIRKSDGKTFDVVSYKIKVIERGTDTEFGDDKLILYSALRRCSFEAKREDYKIVDSWKMA